MLLTYPCKLSNNRTSFCVDFLFFSRFFCVRHSITRFCNVFNRLLVRKGNRGEHGEMNNRSLSRGNFWMPNSSKRRNKRGKLFMLKFFLFFTRKSKPKKSFQRMSQRHFCVGFRSFEKNVLKMS